jgi:predicted nucleic acid-binding protein
MRMRHVPMSYRYVIDSYTWIEYFRGSRAGERARGIVEGGEAATATITLAELRDKYAREGWPFDDDSHFVTSSTTIVNLTKDIAIRAGEINAAMKTKVRDWGMADSIVLATAQVVEAKVLTGDKHFKGVKEAILIE